MQVFQILWPERRGGSEASIPMVAQDGHNSPSDFSLYTRRFVVVATEDWHSTCVYVARSPPRNSLRRCWLTQFPMQTNFDV